MKMEYEDSIICATLLLYLKNNTLKRCQVCAATETPCWRKFMKYSVLCNRCGIQLQRKHVRKKFKKNT